MGAKKLREDIMIPILQLRELLRYDPEDGCLYWKCHRTANKVKGRKAGRLQPSGYVYIGINGKTYLAHRITWVILKGVYPSNQLDHINGNRSDNRIENLREATHLDNMRNKGLAVNNTSGKTGVNFNKADKVWRVFIGSGKSVKYIGRFKCYELACLARDEAEILYYGNFRRSYAYGR